MENIQKAITETELRGCLSGCHSRDWKRFASAITKLDPVLGAVVAMHADAADGNSPDVADWIDPTLREADHLRNMDITTAAAARVWWMIEYTDHEPDEAETEEWFRAVYDREPEDGDREDGLYSLVVAGVK